MEPSAAASEAAPPAGAPGRPREAPGRRFGLVAACSAWSLLAAAVAWRFAGHATDDIFITYRYAANLAAGHGLVFNPGERVFGVTDPGIALLLAAAHAVTGAPIPWLGSAMTAFSLVAIAGLMLAESRRRGRFAEGLLGGTLVVSSAYLWTGQGAGPVPALALLLGAARLAGTGRRIAARDLLAGLCAGAAVWCRPDAAAGAGVLALLLWRERRRPPLAFAAAAGLAVLAGAGVAAAWFGTAIPNTLAAKRHFAALNPRLLTGFAVFWGSALDFFRLYAGPGAWVLLLLGLAGQPALWRGAGRAGRLLALHALVLAVAYTMLRVPFFIWYAAPAVIALLYGGCFLGGAAWRAAAPHATARESDALPAPGVPAGRPAGRVLDERRGGDRRAVPPPTIVERLELVPHSTASQARLRLAPFSTSSLARLGLALLLALLGASWAWAAASWWRDAGAGDWRRVAYPLAGRWIREHSAPADDIAFDEVGMLAYWSERPVEDLIGLVSPRSLPYAAVGDFAGAFLAKPTALVVFHTFDHRGGTRPLISKPWFGAAYREVQRIELPCLGGAISIYRRQPGAPLPPPRPPHRRPRGPASAPLNPASTW